MGLTQELLLLAVHWSWNLTVCFFQPSISLVYNPYWPSGPDFLWPHLPSAGPWAGEPGMSLGSLVSWGCSLWLRLSSHMGVTFSELRVLTILNLCLSYTSHCGYFFIFLVVESFFCLFLGFLIDGYSVNSFNFCVLIENCQFRVFLLCHPGYFFW